jgi:hypothetical protein
MSKTEEQTINLHDISSQRANILITQEIETIILKQYVFQ